MEARVRDARDLDLEPESFDAAISRLALMLIPERAQAMAGIHRALKTGKKFAALVLATADECLSRFEIPPRSPRRAVCYRFWDGSTQGGA